MSEGKGGTERHGRRICRLADESASAADPDAALRALAELSRELDAFVRVQVSRALAADRSFADVARALGISRQAAHRRFRTLAPERGREQRRPLAATDAARRAVRLARAEALATDTAPGSDHILLGILRTDSDAARALRSEGVTLPTALDCVRSTNGSRAGAKDLSCIRRILRLAARDALARGERELDLDQLLLTALEAPDGGARRTLSALAVDPAAVQARLRRRGPRNGRRCVAT